MRNIPEFQQPYTVTDFNTNNGWGFGGGVGKSFKFNEHLELRIGKAYYRHLKPEAFIALYFQGVRVLDLSGHGKKQIAYAQKWIDALLSGQYQESDIYPYVALL